MFRIGFGVDFHRFARKRRLVLGGVEVPHPRGLDGHSDADVLTHAVCDALLGAACLGDIGEHFPDSDPKYKGISSLVLLKEVARKVRSGGFRIVNIDVALVLQEPRISGYKAGMKKNLVLATGCKAVNIKATTPERLGAVGRGEGAECRAVALLSGK
jgi:2-C-methyl-D-erythritol 2,4-cyclodiphosphate synthase